MSNLILQTIGEWMNASLQTGPMAVVALSILVSTVIIPLTLYRWINSITVAYGYSVAFVAYRLSCAFSVPNYYSDAASLLAAATIFHGLVLGSYLFLRDWSGYRPFIYEDMPMMKRLLVSLTVSVLYALMMTPLLYALRSPVHAEGWARRISYFGAYMAWAAAIGEVIADGHKHVVKNYLSKNDQHFSGPFRGLYRVTRHPNYMCEATFWLGTFITGTPSIQNSIVGWTAAVLGAVSIIYIVIDATNHLEQCHKEKYGDQDIYEEWKRQVPYALFPFIC